MSEPKNEDPIRTFLGSAHIFANAVAQIIEEKVWREAVGNQLTVSQLKLLKLVSLSGEHKIGDVAAFLGISNAAASKAVDKLVRRMLLRRSEGEADRRAIHLSVTGPGRRLLEAHESATKEKLAEILGDMPPGTLSKLTDLLDQVSSKIIAYSAQSEDICVQCGIYFRERCLVGQELSRRCLYMRQKDAGRKAASQVPTGSGPDS
jgi:DNA-binding MarR family transcriptional regulator